MHSGAESLHCFVRWIFSSTSQLSQRVLDTVCGSERVTVSGVKLAANCGSKRTVQVTACQETNAAASQHKEKWTGLSWSKNGGRQSAFTTVWKVIRKTNTPMWIGCGQTDYYYYCQTVCEDQWTCFYCVRHWPSLAGDHPHLLHLSLWRQLSGLPPLVVGGVHHMKDVSKLKVQSLTGQTRVSGLIVVKQSSTHTHRSNREICCLLKLTVRFIRSPGGQPKENFQTWPHL